MTGLNLKNLLLELNLSFLSSINRKRLFSRGQLAWPTDSPRGPMGPKQSGDDLPSEGQ